MYSNGRKGRRGRRGREGRRKEGKRKKKKEKKEFRTLDIKEKIRSNDLYRKYQMFVHMFSTGRQEDVYHQTTTRISIYTKKFFI